MNLRDMYTVLPLSTYLCMYIYIYVYMYIHIYWDAPLPRMPASSEGLGWDPLIETTKPPNICVYI